MSLEHKRSSLSLKDKQSIILQLEKAERGTNLSAEYGINKRQISDNPRNEEGFVKFADNLETNEELKCKSLTVFYDEQLNQVLFHN